MYRNLTGALKAGLLLAGLVTTAFGTHANVLASGPQLTLNPGSATPGSTVTIAGSNFLPQEMVTIYLNNATTTVPASASGTFSIVAYLMPSTPAGSQVIVARGSSGDQASATLNVVTSGSSPTSSPPSGTTATATSAPPTNTPTTDPPTATSTSTHLGTATLSLSPSAAAPGSTVAFSGSGFKPGELVSVYWNGTLFAEVYATSGGSFSFSAWLSSGNSAGSRSVVAQGSSGDRATATFTVLGPTAPSPTPTSPAASSATPTSPAGPSPTAPAGIPTSGTTSNGCQITPAQATGEQYLFNLLNQHRSAVGARPLVLNETLSLASRQHSCDMFQHQNLSHYGSDGSSPFQRIAALGIRFSTAGENIGMAGGYSLTGGINVIDNSMMAEPATPGTHHWNIINSAYSQVGIGVIYANNQVWLTEDFIG